MGRKSLATRSGGSNGAGAARSGGRRAAARPRRHVKIVATIGPASRSPAALRRLVAAGVDVVRLNMSHGTHQEHAEVVARVRAIEPSGRRPLAVLLDLSGPKLRTGLNAERRPARLVRGREVVLTPRRVPTTDELVSVTYDGLSRDLQPGGRVLLDDGMLELEVVRVEGKDVRCRVVVGGELGEHKGIHLPGAWVSAPSMTAKDRRDLRFGIEQGVDLVALSFVRTGADVDAVRRVLRRAGTPMPVIAKLETQQAIEHLDEIVERAGGVMVARGDLGLDLPPEHVPLAQKRIIRTANLAGRPVITATQMLESMTRRPRPTRAEATDVANAVLDGTDAVMLSGETAAGSYPLESVEMMARIIRATEGGQLFASQVAQPDTARINPHASDADAISVAAVSLARQTGASALVVYTLSGTTALLVSRQRPAMPIFALTPSEEVRRRLAVVWGVTAFVVPETDSVDRLLAVGEEVLLTQRALKKGQCVVRVAGTTDTAGGTNVVQLSRVGQVARQRTWAG